MIQLPKSRNAWGTPEFNATLKQELQALDSAALPLQQALAAGSHVLENRHSAMVLALSETTDLIHAKVGIFFNSILAGCSCADDPTPISELNEYCELLLEINKQTAAVMVTLAGDAASPE